TTVVKGIRDVYILFGQTLIILTSTRIISSRQVKHVRAKLSRGFSLTSPVRLSVSFSIHAGNSILLQRYLYRFLRMRQQHIHNLKKDAGIPHVYIGDLQTIPMPFPPPSRNWWELSENFITRRN
ncbi:MAG: hypothetical protein OXD45_06640, partial [Rhodobacteraceae bacterium]|nr:hypothetical protein [Paracoccaceae bacterium]